MIYENFIDKIFLELIKGGNGMRKTKEKKENEGITLIALVITIIVLLILARNKYNNINRKQWNFNTITRSKG